MKKRMGVHTLGATRLATATTVVLAACGTDVGSTGSRHEVMVDAIGDSTGRYAETLGRRGEGPGEFSRAEAMALLPDGRLVVRDPGNQRIEVIGPGAGHADQWRYNSGNAFTVSSSPTAPTWGRGTAG